ncbi:MAG: NTP transferase domain-containing protein [Anaerolineae bacterium]|nr:NTP transferase domain-containing protein [Anaerolineae bacterium]
MDALVTAGGSITPDDPLYAYGQDIPKSLLDVAGKPMVQWVLDALGGSDHVDNVVVMGVDESQGVSCSKPTRFLPDSGNMIGNVRRGTEEIQRLNPDVKHILVVSGDIPGITTEIVDWTIERINAEPVDICYFVVTKEVMEERFPDSNRTFTKLKGAAVSGGDMNSFAAEVILGDKGLWDRLHDARKNPLKQAAIVGFDTLFLILFRLVDLQGAASYASKRLGLKARAEYSPYAEMAMDVDKPNQLELLRSDLSQ